jgi:hypothetical protein
MSADSPRSVMEEARRAVAKLIVETSTYPSFAAWVGMTARFALARDKRAAEIAMAMIAQTQDEYQKEMAEAIAEAILAHPEGKEDGL